MITDTAPSQAPTAKSSRRCAYAIKRLAALGVALPWAAAKAATAFADGDIDLSRMARIGAVATPVLLVIAATMHLLLFPFI